MGAGNYSVEASVLENGKTVKGTLTLFIDEYVFGGKRVSVNWEKVSIEQATVKIKAFLRTVDKPAVVFFDGTTRSTQFILEPENKDALMSKVKEFSDSIRSAREEKENKARQEEEARQRQVAEEQPIKKLVFSVKLRIVKTNRRKLLPSMVSQKKRQQLSSTTPIEFWAFLVWQRTKKQIPPLIS